MTNHVHLIVIPERAESLPLALKQTHGRYASYLNARSAASGHVWQGRYYSCPLDPHHCWAALRYTELNPVRAGMVPQPDVFPWSSAAAHCGKTSDARLDMKQWGESWTPETWCEFLGAAGADTDADVIRRNTHTGRPLGHADFVADLERTLHRRLAPAKGGRPPKERANIEQEAFRFADARG
jgi:putative transposase